MVSAATLAARIVEKGLDEMDFSMLTESLRFEILTVTGDLFLKKGNVGDAVRSFVIARNMDRLSEVGDWLLEQGRWKDAALCFIPTGNRDVLEKVGFRCIDEGDHSLALKCFEASGDRRLVEFLQRNL